METKLSDWSMLEAEIEESLKKHAKEELTYRKQLAKLRAERKLLQSQLKKRKAKKAIDKAKK